MTISQPARWAAAGTAAVLAGAWLAIALSRGGTPAAASTPPPASGAGATGISVTGTGIVAGRPDALRLSMTVSTSGSTVTAALKAANSATEKVQKALLSHGVDKKDLQTSGLSVQVDYDMKGRPNGYRVNESLTATLRNLSSAGEAIGEAAAAGGDATRIDGVSLDLSDSSALVADARKRAFADAREKAEQYARAAGRDLGEVISLDETTTTAPPQPLGMRVAAASAKEMAVPIQAGSQDVQVVVHVVFGFA